MNSKLIRGMRPWDFKTGRVVTELHRHLELQEDGFKSISLQIGNTTKYFHFDMQNLKNACEQAMEMWLALREARKQDPKQTIIMKTEK